MRRGANRAYIRTRDFEPSSYNSHKSRVQNFFVDLCEAELLTTKGVLKEVAKEGVRRFREAALVANRMDGVTCFNHWLSFALSEEFGLSLKTAEQVPNLVIVPAWASIVQNSGNLSQTELGHSFVFREILALNGIVKTLHDTHVKRLAAAPNFLQNTGSETLTMWREIARSFKVDIPGILARQSVSEVQQKHRKPKHYDFASLPEEGFAINGKKEDKFTEAEGLLLAMAMAIPDDAISDWETSGPHTKALLSSDVFEPEDSALRGAWLRRMIAEVGARVCGITDENDVFNLAYAAVVLMLSHPKEAWNEAMMSPDIYNRADPTTLSIFLRIYLMAIEDSRTDTDLSAPFEVPKHYLGNQKASSTAKPAASGMKINQALGEFYDYHNNIKARWRATWKDFLEPVLTHCRPEEMRVVFLPGVRGGEVPVYDPIPRQNLIAVEGGSSSARQVFKETMEELGIQPRCQTLEELVREEPPEVEIISIDSNRYFDREYLKFLQELPQTPHAVILLNFMAGRESRDSQELLHQLVAPRSDKISSSQPTLSELREGLDTRLLEQLGIGHRVREIFGVGINDPLPISLESVKTFLTDLGSKLQSALRESNESATIVNSIPSIVPGLILQSPIILRHKKIWYTTPGGTRFNTLMAEIIRTPELLNSQVLTDFFIPWLKISVEASKSWIEGPRLEIQRDKVILTHLGKQLAEVSKNELFDVLTDFDRPSSGTISLEELGDEARQPLISVA